MRCSGKCGREGEGRFDSGGIWPPAVDRRYSWCDQCWRDLLNKRMPAGLAKDLPPGTLLAFSPRPVTAAELS